MAGKKIDANDIKIKFGGKFPPKDEKLIKLLKKGYKGEIDCYKAIIKTEGIKPFSDFKPDISDEYKIYFVEKLKERNFPFIYVYQEKGKFIMSDDYNSYYSYLEYKFRQIPCVVIGEPKGKYLVKKGEPFKLPVPEVEIL